MDDGWGHCDKCNEGFTSDYELPTDSYFDGGYFTPLQDGKLLGAVAPAPRS